MSGYLLTIGCVTFIWLLNQWRIRHFGKLAKSLPSNKLHTWLGFGPILKRNNTFNYINEHGKKYGKNSVFWTGPFSFFLTYDPVSINDIIASKYCIDKPTEYNNILQSTSGNGLLLLNDPEWSQHRKLLNTAFSHGNLVSFIATFNSEVDNFIQRIDSNINIGTNGVFMLKLIKEITFSTITKAILKRTLDEKSVSLNELTENLTGAVHYMTDMGYNLALKFKLNLLENSIYKDARRDIIAVKGFLNESIEMYVKKKNNNANSDNNGGVNGAIDHAINGFKQNKLKESDLESEILHIYIAAFDTTSNTLYSIIILLAMHPEYQQRLYEEIASILIDDDTTVTYEKVQHMVYMDMVINESLRILPSVPQIIRCVHGNNVTLSNGITLPENQKILIDLYNLHRNKEVWGPEADKFNPHNFLPANMESKQHGYAPFGKGTRICIGRKFALLSLKVSLAKILKKYKFKTDYKYENLKIESFVVIKFLEHPDLKIESR